MRFYLSGQRTFGNRGCEAIVRSTVSALRREFGDVEVLVPSDDTVRDAAQWPKAQDLGVRFVKAYLPWYQRYWVHAQRLPWPALKRLRWPFPFPRWLKEQIQSVDVVLSVGGDNYSLDYRLPSLLMGIDRLAMDMDKPVFLWGASVGPFEGDAHFVPAIKRHLEGFSKILVRESVSFRYLTEVLLLKNVSQMVDPAFTLEPEALNCDAFWPQAVANGVIGLNVSPLIERYKKLGQDLVDETACFVRDCVQTSGFGVVLIPHVGPLDGTGKNSDAHYMASILQRCVDLGSTVTMVPPTLNAAQLKHVISQLRFFIGARTHATIAALSSGVPTVSIAYSVKARGINRDLFSNEAVVLPTPDLSAKTLQEKLDYLQANEESLREKLAQAMPTYRRVVFECASMIASSE